MAHRNAPLDTDALRRRRIEAGINQRTLADAAGISPGHMSMIENGQNGVSPGVLSRLAAALGCEVADLLADATEGVA